ncbi:hypothetical protein GLYMA_07G101866v4 [Glycine max]|nr:hypothetical protein GLYMA_07G101866v4 [Glycine max]KAH1086217.1 hypothetical protein GYH30_017952 [Glycine max]
MLLSLWWRMLLSLSHFSANLCSTSASRLSSLYSSCFVETLRALLHSG